MTLLRHCQSVFNKDPKSTELDCPLTPKGIQDASQLSGTYDIIVHSPLKRAIQTLTHSHMQATDSIIETSLVKERKTDMCDFLEGEEQIYETEEQLMERINMFSKWIHDRCTTGVEKEKKSVLVITHADFIFYLPSSMSKGERFGTWLDNGEKLKIKISNPVWVPY